jgi:hypothetical protein
MRETFAFASMLVTVAVVLGACSSSSSGAAASAGGAAGATAGVGGAGAGSSAGGGPGAGGAAMCVPAPTSVSKADFPEALATALCGCVAGCCSPAGFAFDVAACRAGAMQSATEQIAETETYPDLAWDPVKAATNCVGGLRELAVSCGAAGDAYCDAGSLLTGTLPLGSACMHNDATGNDPCAAGAKCSAPSGMTGTCEPAPPPSGSGPPAGSACKAAGDCAKALYCKNGLCAPGEGLGAPCMFDVNCAKPLYCHDTSKTCVMHLTSGSPCVMSSIQSGENHVCNGYCVDGKCAGFSLSAACTGK